MTDRYAMSLQAPIALGDHTEAGIDHSFEGVATFSGVISALIAILWRILRLRPFSHGQPLKRQNWRVSFHRIPLGIVILGTLFAAMIMIMIMRIIINSEGNIRQFCRELQFVNSVS